MTPQEVAEKFVSWTKKKIRHDLNQEKRQVYFEEREIWWAALGKNIGFEIDGKNELFERPVLILKKYFKDMCFVLPTSTKVKDEKPWYQIHVTIDGEIRSINITQGRVISVKRLLRKKTKLDSEQFAHVRSEFRKQFE